MTVETERRIKISQITQRDRLILSKHRFTIIKLTGKSLREQIENGDLPISEYQINPELIPDIILNDKSRISEVVYDLTQLFLPDSNKASYDDQSRILRSERKYLEGIGIKDMEPYMVSVAEAAEVAAIELTKGNRIFGRNFVNTEYSRYPWVRTSTEIDPNKTAIIGCDDLDTIPEAASERLPEGAFRGIHIRGDVSKDNITHGGLYVMRVFRPTL
ncbi:MAG: hypothetical protein ABH812_01605 [bacterium]